MPLPRLELAALSHKARRNRTWILGHRSCDELWVVDPGPQLCKHDENLVSSCPIAIPIELIRMHTGFWYPIRLCISFAYYNANS